MTDNNTTFSKKIIEIADIIFADPTKEMSEIVSEIVRKCHKSDRTAWRWIKKAQEYNSNRIKKQEDIRNSILEIETKKCAVDCILTRNESLVILSKISKGEHRKVNDEILVPTDADRIRAVQQLAKMQGWDAPDKGEINVSFAKPLSKKDRARIEQELEKDY